MSLPKIIDNRRRQLSDVLTEISSQHDYLSIATGYWDLAGMGAIFDQIKDYKSIRLLIGQEPLIPRHKNKLSLDMPQSDFPDRDISFDLTQLLPQDKYRIMISQIKAMIEAGKLEVRVYRRDFLHAKCYIFGNDQSQEAVGVIGSSNFTGRGLTTNTELNALESDQRIVRYNPRNEGDEHGHLSWFNDVWEDEMTEVWDGRFQEILSKSPVGDTTYSPYEMYIKTLWEVYENEIIDEPRLSSEITDQLYPFQKRNAELLLKKLEANGLAMLADSVGLGKTITAAAVLKYYRDQGAKRIYVIVPAGLRNQWKEELAKVLKLFGVEILSMQNFREVQEARRIDKWAQVDLFIVDEAHNLRSSQSKRHQNFLEWFAANPQAKILMLTATPINNYLHDLSNQIQLAAKGKLHLFNVVYPTGNKKEVISFFEAVDRLNKEIKVSRKRQLKPDFEKVYQVMRQGLQHFLVRTTRQGIEKEGGLVKDGQERQFPEGHVDNHSYRFNKQLDQQIHQLIKENISAFAGQDPTTFDLDSLLDQTQHTSHPLDTINALKRIDPVVDAFRNILQLLQLIGFTPYRPMLYHNQFHNKSLEDIRQMDLSEKILFKLHSQMSIHNLLRVNFLKRLESSAYALEQSLSRYSQRLESFASELLKGKVLVKSDIETIEDELDSDFQTEPSQSTTKEDEFMSLDGGNYNLEALQRDINRDRQIIEVLIQACQLIMKHDDKLASLEDLLKSLSGNPRAGNKILVFSHYADTIDYLQEKLPSLITNNNFPQKSGFVSGRTGTKKVQELVAHFSPLSQSDKEFDKEKEINYLFSTDVLSEGRNLQDCGMLINFDLHWNPVRMIQRNGRINRLGSPHKSVFIYNMYPEATLDTYLKLVQRLENKIDNIRHTIGTDQSVLGEKEMPIEYIDQPEQLKIADIYNPDKKDIVYEQSMQDDDEQLLNSDEYVYDLRQFCEQTDQATQQRIKNIPLGKWGYMPSYFIKSERPQILALTHVSGLKKDGVLAKRPVFVRATIGKDIRVETLEPLEALQYLRTQPTDNDSLPDKIDYNRTEVKRLVKLEARRKSETNEGFRLTKTHRLVLNRLTEVAPYIRLGDSIKMVETVIEQNKIKSLFKEAYQLIKKEIDLNPGLIQRFEEFANQLNGKYNETQEEVTQVQEVLFYVRQK